MRIATLAAILVFAAGCSSSSTPSPAPDAGLTALQACTDAWTARCNRLSACSPFQLKTKYGDLASCVDREVQNCVLSQAVPQTAATPQGLEGCADAIPAVSCHDYLANQLPGACQPAAGPLAADAVCATAAQCQTTVCLTPKNTACGSCQPLPQVGDSCLQVNDCARSGLRCAPNNTCQPAATLGGSCDKDAGVCDVGLFCNLPRPYDGGVGTCDALAEDAGAPCIVADGGESCDANAELACNTLLGQCAPRQYAQAGAPCGVDDGGTTINCLAGGSCVRDAGVKLGTCEAAAAVGSACDLASGPDCFSPARCIVPDGGGTAGTCLLTQADGCQ
jgi:hypothetical protein